MSPFGRRTFPPVNCTLRLPVEVSAGVPDVGCVTGGGGGETGGGGDAGGGDTGGGETGGGETGGGEAGGDGGTVVPSVVTTSCGRFPLDSFELISTSAPLLLCVACTTKV